MQAWRKFWGILAALLFSLPISLAYAQWAPGRSVRIIVPFPPGGTADLLVRLVTQEITQSNGQTFVVEYRPGAGTIIGTEAAAKAAPDGMTLLLTANSFVINPILRSNLAYDPLTGFEPICILGVSPQILAVNGASPYQKLADLVVAAGAKPGELSIGANGPATAQHIAAEMFKHAANINLTFIPFSGGAPATTALLGEHITSTVENFSEIVEHVPSGKLRPLAVMASERFEPLPNIPTMVEAGYPGALMTAWFGLVAPAKTSKEMLAQMTATLKSALANSEIRTKLAAQGLNPSGACGADFAAHLQQESQNYARVIKDANIKAE